MTASQRVSRRRSSVFDMTPERVAAGRVVAGVALVFGARGALAWWTGSRDPGAAVLVRAIGARDIALGLGGLAALRRGETARRWFEAAALADASDVACTILALRRDPVIGRAGFLIAAVAGLGANLQASRQLARAQLASSPTVSFLWVV